MRRFDYQEKWKNLLTPEIVSYLTQIHEFKGEQTLLIPSSVQKLMTTTAVYITKIRHIYLNRIGNTKCYKQNG